ncbi:hypothetical protein B0H21DRAFT_776353 [Amylocystis lapponica]|nr:hypothetical protein B0H21DRAFT_776353 [Amylocystis lapponica]
MSPRPHPILKPDSFPAQACIDLPFTRCGKVISPHLDALHPFPRTYDRAPIVVSPNVCQLPKRGARKLHSPPVTSEPETRGRSRSRGRGNHRAEETVKGSYFHPRAYEACEPEPLDVPSTTFDLPSPPPLVWSPSDDSDDPVETPSDLKAPATPAYPLHRLSSTPAYAPEGQKEPRPQLPPHFEAAKSRVSTLVKSSRGRRAVARFSPGWDEGCLGGF